MKKWITLIVISSILLIISSIGLYVAIMLNKPVATIKMEEAKYESYELETPSTGSPDDYNAKDNVAYALYKFKQMPSYNIKTTGKSRAGNLTEQKVSNTRTKIGNEAIVTTITSGIVKHGTERFFKGVDEKVFYKKASSVDKNTLEATFDYTKAPTCVSSEQYMEDYGWYPYQLTGYIICDETYLKDPTMIKNNDDTYTITLDLDPNENKAPFWYRREILINSSSTMVPEFSKIHIKLTIDNEWKPLIVEYEEVYKVEVVIKVKTTTTVKDEITYDDVLFDENKYSFYQNYLSMEPSE